MRWLDRMLAFDTETTGVDVENDRIVTATATHIQPGQPTHPENWMIAVDVDIPKEATRIHGITTEEAQRDGWDAAVVLDLVAERLAMAMTAGIPVAGMNLAYDFTILDRELRRTGLATLDERIPPEEWRVLDAYVIDKWADPYRKGHRKLVDLCTTYVVRHDGAHDATADAVASARVLWRMQQLSQWPAEWLVDRYKERRDPGAVAAAFHSLGQMSLDELHGEQIEWRREQQESLAEYLTMRGEKPDVNTAWPMKPYSAELVTA